MEEAIRPPDLTKRGRPSANLSKEILLTLQKRGYTAKEMAKYFGCSASLVFNKLQEYGVQMRKKYSSMSDNDLKLVVSRLHNEFPAAGEKLMNGYLLAEGINVQRSRLRMALATMVDRTQKAKKINRREYKVPTPNHIWHMDGHMKLIRWGITTHGCIDGYSRLIVYLCASANNRAGTVFNAFLTACLQYGFPAFVRSDHGGENKQVALFLNLVHSSVRHLTGRSVHNQRIERLWRDVHTQVIETFYNLFYKLEDEGKLDINNEKDINSLLIVYLPEINRRLCSFQSGWNKHSLRTEKNRTPEHLWMNGTLENSHKDSTAVKGILLAEYSLRQQLERGLSHYGLSLNDFNGMLESEQDVYMQDQQNVVENSDILTQDISLEEKFVSVKTFLND